MMSAKGTRDRVAHDLWEGKTPQTDEFGAAQRRTIEGGDAGARFIVRETEDGLGIVVPLARNKAVFSGLGILLLFYAGFSPMVRDRLPEGWFAFWLIAGAAIVGALAWKLFGSERLFITNGALVLSHGPGILNRRTVFLLEEVSRARIRTRHVPTGDRGGRMVLRSTIAFDPRGKTSDFGADMEAAERSAVYHAMLRHLPPEAREADAAD